ncbi:MAG: hypothetical protein ACXV7J_12990 [Methylomonas sp.]
MTFTKPISDVDIDTLLARIHGKRVADPTRDGSFSADWTQIEKPEV